MGFICDAIRFLRRYANGRFDARWNEIENREVLGDTDFYIRYYADSDVTLYTCTGVRRVLCKQLNLCNSLPSDNIATLFPDVDIDEVFFEISEELRLVFDEVRVRDLTGTVDSLIRMTQQMIRTTNSDDEQISGQSS